MRGVRRCGSRATGVQKIVVVFSSTAASVIVTPNSMVRMIVSATTDGGQALASGKGHLGGVGEARVWEPASSPTEAPPHRSDTNPTTRQSPTTRALSFPKSRFFVPAGVTLCYTRCGQYRNRGEIPQFHFPKRESRQVRKISSPPRRPQTLPGHPGHRPTGVRGSALIWARFRQRLAQRPRLLHGERPPVSRVGEAEPSHRIRFILVMRARKARSVGNSGIACHRPTLQ